MVFQTMHITDTEIHTKRPRRTHAIQFQSSSPIKKISLPTEWTSLLLNQMSLGFFFNGHHLSCSPVPSTQGLNGWDLPMNKCFCRIKLYSSFRKMFFIEQNIVGAETIVTFFARHPTFSENTKWFLECIRYAMLIWQIFSLKVPVLTCATGVYIF